MSDLVDFLKARLDEDEQVAREAGSAPWEASAPNMIHIAASARRENRAFRSQGYVASTDHGEGQRHIARHDPARVLADVEAKRRIIETEQWQLVEEGGLPERLREIAETEVIQLLALPYADHPDYREEWRP